MKSRYLQYDKKDAKKVLRRLAGGLGGRSAKGGSGLRGGLGGVAARPEQKPALLWL